MESVGAGMAEEADGWKASTSPLVQLNSSELTKVIEPLRSGPE